MAKRRKKSGHSKKSKSGESKTKSRGSKKTGAHAHRVHKPKLKRFCNLRKLLVFAILVLVILVIVFMRPQDGGVSTGEGQQQAGLATEGLVPSGEVADGDTVSVRYVGRHTDGTIFDTNDAAAAEAASFDIKYTEPLTFTIGQNKMIPGFRDAVMSMKKGERKVFSIQPEDGYGLRDPAREVSVPRVQAISRNSEINRTQHIPLQFFAEIFEAEPVVGETVSADGMPWDYEVVAVTEESVSIRSMPELGGLVVVPGAPWNATVTALDDRTVSIRAEVEDGMVIETSMGEAVVTVDGDDVVITTMVEVGQKITTMFWSGEVLAVDDTAMTIDMNHPLAGKVLEFEIELLDVEKGETEPEAAEMGPAEVPAVVTSARPKVELFVMSHCPYGTQAEKAMLPVAEKLGDAIDFEVKFVYYAMHGKKELDEQMNQVCIQDEQSDKFISYLSCFLEGGDGAGCLDTAGVDKSGLASCVSRLDAQYKITEQFGDQSTWLNGRFPLFDVSKTENEAYGIRGSPAVVVNGETISSTRSPAAYLAAVCAAFEDAPAGCDAELDSAAASPGFGYGGTGSTAAGGCGA